MQHVVPVAEPGHFQTRQRLAMFDHRQKVGHDLARVAAIRQPVDHRHMRVMRDFLDLCVIVRSDHDGIGHAAENPCGIGNRFAPAELRRARIKDQRAAAQLAHGDIEADARAGGALLEHHGQYVAGQWLVRIRAPLGPAAPGQLAILRVVDHRRDGIAAGIRQVEEIAHHRRDFERSRLVHAASGTV